MKKQAYGVVDPEFTHQKLFGILDGRGGEYDSSYEEMNSIQNYLESCYFLNINPLPQLRRILPQFLWRFERCDTLSQAKEWVTKSDLIWRVNRWVTDWSEEDIELVTATPIDLMRRRKIFFAGQKNASEATTPELEFVKLCGGEPEYAEIVSK